jgi:transporter family-2 protein
MEGIGLLTIFIGLLGGVAVGVQTPIANVIGQKVGSAASSVVVHISGLVFSVIVLIIYRGENIQNWRTLPWWAYLAGLFGVILYLTINFTIPRIGTTAAISLIIIGQLIAGTVIDHFGFFGNAIHSIDGGRLIGLLLLVIGSYLLTRS